MASQQHKSGPGGHYSGSNPVPNIQRFVESLDKDKKDRDAKINERAKGNKGSEAVDHTAAQRAEAEGSRKTVTDPTTGREVQIEDVNDEFMKAAHNPQVYKIINSIEIQTDIIPSSLCPMPMSINHLHSRQAQTSPAPIMRILKISPPLQIR